MSFDKLLTESNASMIKVENLRKWFPLRKGILASIFREKELFIKAVDDVSFEIHPNEVLGLLGESGCGKTTTGRVLLRLIDPTSGRVLLDGTDITTMSQDQLKLLRKRMQIVFQNPYESMNPRMKVRDILSSPLKIQRPELHNTEETVLRALEEAGLAPAEEFVNRYPHELSGGQRQRTAIARAFILAPEFVVADEPVSMLDISIRNEVLNNLLAKKEQYKTAILFITHDLSLARHVCNRLLVMYLGEIVEIGDAEEIVQQPLHPYTQALVAAVPVPDPNSKRGDIPATGEVPNLLDLPLGCRFHPRCPYAMDVCKVEEPKLLEATGGHSVACHLVNRKDPK
jgi:peptide/nickel transport system ATP-binding protein